MNNLAAKFILIAVFVFLPVSAQSGGIPVIDGANLSQNVLVAFENIAQTLKQIQEYRTQLQQYARQLQDAEAPDEYIWDEADQVIDEMLGVMSSLEKMKDLISDYDTYLERFEKGMTVEELEEVYEIVSGASSSERGAIDELISTIDNQQSQISSDAERLIELQEKAELSGEGGHMEAMQTANMLSSQMSYQLLQMRAAMIAQNNAEAAYRMKRNDTEARYDAAKRSKVRGSFKKSTKAHF